MLNEQPTNQLFGKNSEDLCQYQPYDTTSQDLYDFMTIRHYDSTTLLLTVTTMEIPNDTYDTKTATGNVEA